MECDKCGNPAKVHLTQLVGGQVKKIALCNECASSSGVTDPTGFALADMLLQPGQSASSLAPEPAGGGSGGRKCPQCGFSLEDLKKVRRFGCGTCYTTFRDTVKEMLATIHKGTTHCGKVPDGLMERRQRELRINELDENLKRAIGAENYEEAAGIRDEIQKLEEELGRGGDNDESAKKS